MRNCEISRRLTRAGDCVREAARRRVREVLRIKTLNMRMWRNW